MLAESTSSTFVWQDYFNTMGLTIDIVGDINVATVQAIISSLYRLSSVSESCRKCYIIFHVVNTYAAHLPAVFVDASFDFYEKELKGTVSQVIRYLFLSHSFLLSLSASTLETFFGSHRRVTWRSFRTALRIKVFPTGSQDTSTKG